MADLAPGSGPAVTAADWEWLRRAIELSRCCPPSASAFCVGTVIVAADLATQAMFIHPEAVVAMLLADLHTCIEGGWHDH